jgi:hypothetical protein
MSRTYKSLLKIAAATAALAFAFLAFAPDAHSQELKHGVELFAGAGYASNSQGSDFDLSNAGIRLHFDWSERWGVEASYTSQDQDILEADLFEAAARFAFYQNPRVRVIAFAGAGLLSYDFSYHLSQGNVIAGEDDTLAVHAGIAAEIALGDRLYLRPDFRQRWAIDLFGPYENSSSQASLGLGYRF